MEDPFAPVAGPRALRRARAGRTLAALSAAAALGVAPAVRAGDGVRVESAAFEGALDGDAAGVRGPMRLVGVGLYRWGWLLKVYAAAHYVGAQGSADPDADVPRRLELVYLVRVPGRRLAEVAAGALAGAYRPEELAPLRGRLDRALGAFRDVRPGDRYALTYTPGQGTTLSLNGEPLVAVPGADFARACFGIWLGDRPVDRGLRRALLADPERPGAAPPAASASARR